MTSCESPIRTKAKAILSEMQWLSSESHCIESVVSVNYVVYSEKRSSSSLVSRITILSRTDRNMIWLHVRWYLATTLCRIKENWYML